jgi:lipopolysaccharide/colanic/teichoic acid biosynthesis glycosyltransferase
MPIYPDLIKPLLDRSVALIALLMLAPVFFTLMLMLYLTNHRPVFFRQKRIGKGNRSFMLLKFKSMNDRRDQHGNLLPDQERLTDFGKWIRKTSLDELPQLINVLRGDMSLIGPRPLLPEYLPLYNERQICRHQVFPGITGWAQVNGRNAISWEEKFEKDVWYVERQSFMLDMRIFWMTFIKILQKEGISQAGEATMKPFQGSSGKSA